MLARRRRTFAPALVALWLSIPYVAILGPFADTAAAEEQTRLREMIIAADLMPYKKVEAGSDLYFLDLASEQFVSFQRQFAGKVVFANIWATWCKPCIREMPSLQALHDRFSDRGFTVVGMNDERRERQRKFLGTYSVTFPCLVGNVEDLAFRWRNSVPETYVFDRHGRILGYRAGSQDWMGRRVQELVEYLTTQPNGK